MGRPVHCQNVECSVLLTHCVPRRVTAVMHRIESAYAQLVNMRSKSNHSLRTSSQKCNNLDGPAGNRQYDYLLAAGQVVQWQQSICLLLATGNMKYLLLPARAQQPRLAHEAKDKICKIFLQLLHSPTTTSHSSLFKLYDSEQQDFMHHFSDAEACHCKVTAAKLAISFCQIVRNRIQEFPPIFYSDLTACRCIILTANSENS